MDLLEELFMYYVFKSFIRHVFANIYFQSVICFNSAFEEQKFLILMKSYLSLSYWYYRVRSKKSLPREGHTDFLPCFLMEIL